MERNLRPKVSVVIPSYNHGAFISDAIQSVLKQTFQDYELIIADDASTDNSIEVIETFKDSRIQFYKFEENQGAVYTLNYIIQKAKGEFIALLNSDDSWLANKLELQVGFLEANKSIGAVFTDAQFVNEEGKVLGKKDFYWADAFEQPNRNSGQWLKRFFFELNCLCHPSILIRKELYEKTTLYDSTLRQLPDFAMWVNLLKFTSIHVIDQKLVTFRILSKNQNTSAVTQVNRTRNKNEIYFIMKDFFKDVDESTFIEGFGENFQLKDKLSAAEIACEKALLYFKIENEISYIYKLIGLEKLQELLKNEITKKALLEKYNFMENDFFDLTGKYEIIDAEHNTLINIVKDKTESLDISPRLYSKLRTIYNFFRKK